MTTPMLKADYRHLRWDYFKSSPGSPGCFLKAYSEADGVKHYYKMSSFESTVGSYGHESLNEVVASNVAEAVGLPHLEYKLVYGTIEVNGKEYDEYFTDTESFCKNGESKIPLGDCYDIWHQEEESPIDFVKRMGWMPEIEKMMAFDFLICNWDRHDSNIEVLKKEDGMALAPFFDNGLSLCFSCMDSEEKISSYKTNLNAITNNYLGSRSLKENLAYVSTDFLKRISETDFNEAVLFKGLLGVTLPFFPAYKDKVFEIITERQLYIRELCKEREAQEAKRKGREEPNA